MIELASPWALVLAPLPLVVWWLTPPHRQRVQALRFPFFRRITEAAGVAARTNSIVLRRTRLQMVAAVLVWVLLVLALARPERVGEPVEITKAARDLVLAIDISGSMDERDFAGPDGAPEQRLAAVKTIVGDFVAARDGDRVALIVFGSKAFVQAPFTEDLQSVVGLLDQTEVGMAGPHTALGDAIGLALSLFRSSDIEQRLLVVLSDGADTGSRMSPVNAAEIAAREGVVIQTIGVGREDGSGENRLDARALKDIAARAGGQFFYATDAAALGAIYAEIDKLAPRKVETVSFRPREPLAHLALGLAVVIALATLVALEIGRMRAVRS